MSDPASFQAGICVEDWRVVREIGPGAMGHVFLAERNEGTGKPRFGALKALPAESVLPPVFHAFWEKDREILSSMPENSNTVRFLPQRDYRISLEGREFYYLLTEYCPGGLSYLRLEYPNQSMPPTDVFFCLEQIVRGCQSIHAKGMIHGDLREDNILVDERGGLKIADCGVSLFSARRVGRDRRLGYCAPEVLGQAVRSEASDIWSIGVLSYRLLTGVLPFQGEDEPRLLRQIQENELRWPAFAEKGEILDALVYFVTRMLAPEARQRPQIDELAQVIHRSLHLLAPEKIHPFEERARAHAEKQDLRKREAEPAPERGGKTSALPPAKTPAAFWNRNLGIFLSLAAFVSLALLACFFAIPRFTPPAGVKPPEEPRIELGVEMLGEAASDRFALRLALKDELGAAVSWEGFSDSKRRILVQCRHSEGLEDSLSPTWKEAFQDGLVWRIPEEFPDGEVTLWAEMRIGDEVLMKSDPISLSIRGLGEDRLGFQKARDSESLAGGAEDPEKLLRAYAEYLETHPQGLFREEARQKIERYRGEAAKLRYPPLQAYIGAHPSSVQEILARCEAFCRDFPGTPECEDASRTASAYRKLLVRESYRITLLKGNCEAAWERPDMYVKVYLNQALAFVSKCVPDDPRPTWNQAFEVTWRSGDRIKVELCDKNPGFWGDSVLLRAEDASPFSIRALQGRLTSLESANWVSFHSDFPVQIYPESVRRQFQR